MFHELPGMQGLVIHNHSLGGLKNISLHDVRGPFPFSVFALTTCLESFLVMSHPSLQLLAVSELFECSWNFVVSHVCSELSRVCPQ